MTSCTITEHKGYKKANAIRRFLLLAVLFSMTFKVFGQPLTVVGRNCGYVSDDCSEPTITMPAIPKLCPGAAFTFTVNAIVPYGFTFMNYTWNGISSILPSPATGTSNPLTAEVPVATACQTYSLTVQAIGSTNLIQGNDGNFSLFNDTCSYIGCMESTYGTDCCGACGDMAGHIKIGDLGCMGGDVCPPTSPVEKGHTHDWTYCLMVHGNSGGVPYDAIPYFWGEVVYLCSSQRYAFTYWSRPYSSSPASDQPKIQTVLGNYGSGETLENGYASGADLYLSTIGYIGPATGGCNAEIGDTAAVWQQITDTFQWEGYTGPVFICMYDINDNPGQFAVDDISLYRIATATQAITICPTDTPTASITCAANGCVGSAFTFTVTGNPTDEVGYKITYPHSGTTVTTSSVTIGSGGTATVTVPAATLTTAGTLCFDITGISTATQSGMCYFPVSISKCDTVEAAPFGGIISAPSFICRSANSFAATISDTGGLSFTWTCAGAGAVVPPGTGTTATFTLTGTGLMTITCTAYGTCGHQVTTKVVTVDPNPAIVPVTGTTTLCWGTYTSLTDADTGGTWSSSNTAMATVNSTGSVYAVNIGTAIITYTLTGPGPSYCQSMDTTLINSIWTPTVSITASAPIVYAGCFITLTGYPGTAEATGGDFWGFYTGTTSGILGTSTSTASSSTVELNGTDPTGMAVVEYVAINMCGANFDTMSIPVIDPPDITLSAPNICYGSTGTASASLTGGTWTSSDGAVATIGSLSGEITSVSPGTAVLTYTLPLAAYCSETATTVITINPLPTAITGLLSVCAGSTTSLSDGGGGTWSCSGTTVATVNPVSGIVTGIHPGTSTVTYTLPTGCITTSIVTVEVGPSAIYGASSVCLGSLTSVSDSVGGGAWVSGNTAIATVGSLSGIVSGVSEGTVLLTYTISATGCYTTEIFTVNPLPASIIGIDSLCVGTTTALSDTVYGGTWSSSNTAVATIISSSGIVSGVSAGTAIITYTIGTDCETTTMVTVNPLPGAITGTLSVCVGSTTTLSDIPGGGTWTSSNTSVATISASGVVSGITTGVTLIVYTIPTGCTASINFNVNPLPSVIVGRDSVCVGATISLADSILGGTWTSSTTSIATVNTFGTVTGITGGIDTITYTLSTGCLMTKIVTVDPLPIVPAITGTDSLCVGGTVTLSDGLSGGAWTSSNPSVATVSATGVVTGNAAGTSIISYSVTNHCGTTTVIQTVTVENPLVISPITGILGVCSGYTTILSDALAGGLWSTAATSIITINPVTGLVSGLTDGSTSVTYTVTNACGSVAATATVVVDMVPYITTSAVVACQTIANYSGVTIVPNTGCINVCDSSVVRYYANGNAGSTFTWAVLGGVVIATYPPANDSIDILWPTIGISGSLTIYDTFAHCIGKAMACINVIQRPHAKFSSSAASVCLDKSVLFTDLSTADASSSIVSWYWNFGDGSASSVTNPSHTYTASGTYMVTLTVKNGCGCSDSMNEVITVSNSAGPVITCGSIVCDSARAVYSTTPYAGGTYYWSVSGGTIISGNTTTPSITVAWNEVGAGGFGYVSLVEPYADCTDTTTIKVPVIQQTPVITGPDYVCQGEEYQYSLPLWPATKYMWGVIGNPAAIVGSNDNNSITVEFPTIGPPYTIHAWYQNELMLCGSSVDKTITVLPLNPIIGPTTICQGSNETYNFSILVSAGTWVLSEATTGTVVMTAAGPEFTYSFPTPGVYLLSGTATGVFCNDPVTINVIGLPAAIDTVSGTDTVCLNTAYTYKAGHDVPGTIYNWQAIGGTVTPASGSNTVNVVWTSSGTKQLIVNRISTAAPYCTGPSYTVNVVQDNINLNIIGYVTPCANSLQPYFCTYANGDSYSWAIYPNAAGSVVSGNYSSSMNVLWNNVDSATPAQIVVTVHKCDSIKTDTMNVTISPAVAVYVNPSVDPACPNTPVTFFAPAGGVNYTWNFGDGTPSVTTPINISPAHSFPTNTSTGNIFYTVSVTVIPGPFISCPPSGTGTYMLTVQPGPVAYASTGSSLLGCGSMTSLLAGTATDNAGGLTYQWYDDGVAIPGATDTTYTATTTTNQTFSFGVTATTGCSAFSNFITINHSLCTMDSGALPCDTPITIVKATSCNAVSLEVTSLIGSGPHWIASGDTVDGGVLPGSSVTVDYTTPGIYSFLYVQTFGSCYDTASVSDTIGIVPNFTHKLQCDSGNVDSLTLSDYSAFLPWYTIDAITWDINGAPAGSGSTLALTLPVGATYTVTETVSGTRPHGTFSCTHTSIITVPVRPVDPFIAAPSVICEGVPVNFTPSSTAGINSFYWNFGDGSSSLLQSTQRTYTWGGAFNPEHDTAVLTTTDSIGCSAIDTQYLLIYENILQGSYSGNLALCSNALPDILAFFESGGYGTPPYTYLWSNGPTVITDTVTQSGYYWVTVTDATQCQAPMFPAENIKIINTPMAIINGFQNFCIGESVNLSGYAGTGVSYAWLRNGAGDGTAPTISESDSIGTYEFQLIVGATDSASGVTCYDTSTNDSVNVFPLPPYPSITGPTVLDCSTYSLLLSATETTSGTYNWSNGTYGAVNNITSGGPYRVWFTDQYGCISSSDVTVPMSPDSYFPYFPTGCYTICKQQLPITLTGPPDISFSYWAWLAGGDTAISGSNSLMGSYTLDSSGNYQWLLGNGLCAQASETMDVTVVNCKGCQGDSVSATFTCDTSNPATYQAVITLYSPGAGYSYIIGTDIGPIDPFSGMLSYFGAQPPMTLSFTTFDPYIEPDSITVQVMFTDTTTGANCFYKERIPLPPCSGWAHERQAQASDSTSNNDAQPTIATALLIAPNPASGTVNISYNFGEPSNNESLTIYDLMGRKIAATAAAGLDGTWTLDINDWATGVYIVRMEADGKVLQTQKMIVSH